MTTNDRGAVTLLIIGATAIVTGCGTAFGWPIALILAGALIFTIGVISYDR